MCLSTLAFRSGSSTDGPLTTLPVFDIAFTNETPDGVVLVLLLPSDL